LKLPVSAANFCIGVTSALAVLAVVVSAEVAGLKVLVSNGIGAELARLANKLSSW
jgi:hypothetical protein